MKDETRLWLAYADENLQMARIALERGFFNASLQNAQQSVEKVLKALLIERGWECPRTGRLLSALKFNSAPRNATFSIRFTSPPNILFSACCQVNLPTERSVKGAC